MGASSAVTPAHSPWHKRPHTAQGSTSHSPLMAGLPQKQVAHVMGSKDAEGSTTAFVGNSIRASTSFGSGAPSSVMTAAGAS